ncbi:hypothetical protein D3C76_915780 [compost metagenome]
MLLIGLAAEPLQRLPLADPIGVQVRRLLELQQVREQVWTGDQIADTQARQQGFRHGAGVDPTGFLQATGNRLGAAAIEGQLTVRLVFDQGHAKLIQQCRDRLALGFAVTHRRWILERRDQVDERRAMCFQARAQLRQVRAIGLQRHGEAMGSEQLEDLQRRQVGRCLEQNLGAFVDIQLGGQVEGLLGATDHQDLIRLAWHTQRARLCRQGFAQGRFAFTHAVLAHGHRHLVPVDFRQHGFGRQASGERHHLRTLGGREDFTDQGTFKARDTFGKSHGSHR